MQGRNRDDKPNAHLRDKSRASHPGRLSVFHSCATQLFQDDLRHEGLRGCTCKPSQLVWTACTGVPFPRTGFQSRWGRLRSEPLHPTFANKNRFECTQALFEHSHRRAKEIQQRVLLERGPIASKFSLNNGLKKAFVCGNDPFDHNVLSQQYKGRTFRPICASKGSVFIESCTTTKGNNANKSKTVQASSMAALRPAGFQIRRLLKICGLASFLQDCAKCRASWLTCHLISPACKTGVDMFLSRAKDVHRTTSQAKKS